ncbi:MAG: hypothetical protein IKW60_00295 [Clostridia bacterium]|nr:hypothetical protein [Clostridia bacterium]
MKKKLSLIFATVLTVLTLSACGETTMDGGNDTNGMAGEPRSTGTQTATPRGTGSMAEDAGNAVKDAVDGVGNAGKALIDGAERTVNDVTNGMTGK